MRDKIILTFLLCGCLLKSFAQKADTLYWHDATTKNDLNAIKEIVVHINDSIDKKTAYWKGKITSVQYTAQVNECRIPIQQDTFYARNSDEIRATITNEMIQLGKKTNCDSILRIRKIKRYSNKQLVQEVMLKRIGDFADCPCGEWKFYENNKVAKRQAFGSCDDSKLDNIFLVKTIWSPNKQFKLELYKEQMLFAMPGQGSDHMATILLKDKNDTMLQYISSNSKDDEVIMYRDIEVDWDLNQKIVWYGRGRLFYLEKDTK
ncbi:hypothetical protein [Aquimarina algicola]|uniref:GLPGLI family protein n=1 Tax=Aquimarina algicola TaxID=2589995 RepID=A0A504IX44_9FLAO|nr:hypothetical protein [Aquimarina algicola]TPN82976.1 hypothetical protein FHK87_21355 [Aquimarina algicola]